MTKKSAFVTKLGANLVFGTLLNKLKRIFYAIGQICIVVNGQILNKSGHTVRTVLVFSEPLSFAMFNLSF